MSRAMPLLAYLVAVMLPTVPSAALAGSPVPALPTSTCPSPGSSPPTSGTVFGSLKNVDSGAQPAVFVMIFPETPLSRDYVAYLGTLGKPVTFAPGTPAREMIASAQRTAAKMQQFSAMYGQMRVANLGSDGAFACGNLPAGPYVVISQVTHRVPVQGNPAVVVPVPSFYTAVARVPAPKRNAKQRFYSPTTHFAPAEAPAQP